MGRDLPLIDTVSDRIGHLSARAAGVTLSANLVAGVAAAQAGGGGCPLPPQAASGVSATAQQVVGIVAIGCIVVAAVAEGLSRMKRDPQEEADMKEWRNGAAMGVVTVPLLLWFIVNMAGNFGIGIADCVDLVPFF